MITFLMIRKNNSSVRLSPSATAKDTVSISEIAPQVVQKHNLRLLQHSGNITNIVKSREVLAVGHVIKIRLLFIIIK